MLAHLDTEVRGRRAPRDPRAVLAFALILAAGGCTTVPAGTEFAGGQDGAPASLPAPAPTDADPATPVATQAPGGSPEGQASPAAEDAEKSFPIHGTIFTTLRERWTSSEDDLDLASTVSLDLGDPEKNRWTGRLMTRFSGDLDGKREPDSIFFDLDDTYDQAIVTRLYDAYAQTQDNGFLKVARIGRQTLWDAPATAWFDGVSGETLEAGDAHVSLGGYGGVPVHQYESARGGNFIGGLYGQTKPWAGGRLRLDWMRIEEDSNSADQAVDLWKASGWQGIGQNARVEGTVSRLGNEERDWSVAATWWDRENDLSVQASFFELLTTQGDLPLEVDPFYPILYDLFPYHQARLMASKGFGEKFSVQAGAETRRVSDESDQGEWNRDFERYFSTLLFSGVLPASLVLGLTGEIWESQGNDIDSWGVDLSRRFGENVDASVGSFYSLYKVDVASTSESENVRTYFFRVRWKRTKSSAFDLRYDLEDMEPETVQSIRLGWTWRF